MFGIRRRDGAHIGDRSFDRHLSVPCRIASEVHWTPAAVCVEAARMLRPKPMERVLDIGSGPGKFCILASLAMTGIYVGVEQRGHLVEQARRTARRLGAWRSEFIHGDAFDLDWRSYDCLYLYNPFAELMFEAERRIDTTIETGAELYDKRVAVTRSRLELMPAGTRVLTFHGFGGLFPLSYRRVSKHWSGSGDLELWVNGGLDEPPRKAA
jgi:SAM-dependent methyltransferase